MSECVCASVCACMCACIHVCACGNKTADFVVDVICLNLVPQHYELSKENQQRCKC